jgi:hypothetical protein
MKSKKNIENEEVRSMELMTWKAPRLGIIAAQTIAGLDQ